VFCGVKNGSVASLDSRVAVSLLDGFEFGFFESFLIFCIFSLSCSVGVFSLFLPERLVASLDALGSAFGAVVS